MFSDYSVNQMREYVEHELAVWDDLLKVYKKWDQASASYKAIPNNGVDYPVTRDTDVYTILMSASAVTSEANFVYPPFGPYKNDLISLFDPQSTEDRAKAKENYCKDGCDFTLRLTEGWVWGGGRARDGKVWKKLDRSVYVCVKNTWRDPGSGFTGKTTKWGPRCVPHVDRSLFSLLGC